VCAGPDWVYRWQSAALIGLALSEPGWKGTAKRTALTSLLSGPTDWPLAAAIRVAAEVALHEPEATPELRQTLIDLAQTLDDQENCGITTTLLGALEMIPYVPAEYVNQLRSRIAGDENPSPEPSSTPARKRPWWKFWG
jgi:hypothetical protein